MALALLHAHLLLCTSAAHANLACAPVVPAGHLLASNAAHGLATLLTYKGQIWLYRGTSRQKRTLPTLTQDCAELLAQARQLLDRTKPWLPARLWTDQLNQLRVREDVRRYVAGLSPGIQGETCMQAALPECT